MDYVFDLTPSEHSLLKKAKQHLSLFIYPLFPLILFFALLFVINGFKSKLNLFLLFLLPLLLGCCPKITKNKIILGNNTDNDFSIHITGQKDSIPLSSIEDWKSFLSKRNIISSNFFLENGDIRSGYKFNGGYIYDSLNWEPVACILDSMTWKPGETRKVGKYTSTLEYPWHKSVSTPMRFCKDPKTGKAYRCD